MPQTLQTIPAEAGTNFQSVRPFLQASGVDGAHGLRACRALSFFNQSPGFRRVMGVEPDFLMVSQEFTTPSGVQLGGWGNLMLSKDGTGQWHLHAHCSGHSDYQVSVTAVFSTSTGRYISMGMDTFVQGPLIDNQNLRDSDLIIAVSVNQAAITDHWADYRYGTLTVYHEYSSGAGGENVVPLPRVSVGGDNEPLKSYVPGSIVHASQLPSNQGWSDASVLGGINAIQIAAAQNADGRLEIFYVGIERGLYHNWQVTPNGEWFGETRFNGISAQQIAVAKNADGRLEIFYIGADNSLLHNWQVEPNGDWYGESVLRGPNSAREVAVGINQDGRLEIFWVGMDYALTHNWQTSPGGAFANGQNFDGDSGSSLAVGQNLDGRLELFYFGQGTELYHNWQTAPNGPWNGETRFRGDSGKTQIAVGSNADGRLEIFYIGESNFAVYHNYQTSPGGEWFGETRFAQNTANSIVVAQNADKRLEIFYIGTDNRVYHNWQVSPNGSWNGEEKFSFDFSASRLCAASNQDGRLEIFVMPSGS